jgi:hypothetical protein
VVGLGFELQVWEFLICLLVWHQSMHMLFILYLEYQHSLLGCFCMCGNSSLCLNDLCEWKIFQMKSLLVGLLVYSWYKAYLSYPSVKRFEFVSLLKVYRSYLSIKTFEFLSLYFLALFEQLFEASQIDNLAQNS